MNTPDDILSKIERNTPIGEIGELDKYLPEFSSKGYVAARYDTQNNPIFVRITPQGVAFLRNGGYAAMKRERRRKWWLSELWKALKYIITLGLGILIDRIFFVG